MLTKEYLKKFNVKKNNVYRKTIDPSKKNLGLNRKELKTFANKMYQAILIRGSSNDVKKFKNLVYKINQDKKWNATKKVNLNSLYDTALSTYGSRWGLEGISINPFATNGKDTEITIIGTNLSKKNLKLTTTKFSNKDIDEMNKIGILTDKASQYLKAIMETQFKKNSEEEWLAIGERISKVPEEGKREISQTVKQMGGYRIAMSKYPERLEYFANKWDIKMSDLIYVIEP